MAMRSPKWLMLAALITLSPDTPGVFELWDDGEVVYDGATRDKDATLRSELEPPDAEAAEAVDHLVKPEDAVRIAMARH